VTAVLPGGPAGPASGTDGRSGSGGSSPGGPTPGLDSSSFGGPEAAFLSALGLDRLGFPPMALVPTLVTTSGVATMAMAFSLFGKRRRDDDVVDEDLPERAAEGVGVTAQPGMPPVAVAVLPRDAEADMPRWRRPSLLQARKADPIRDAVEVPRLSFDNGLVGPIDGGERRLIRYDVVTLLDAPDELRGNHIGYLAQGDEVQLLEKRGVYWLVLTPDGSQGWVHRTTLGAPVGEAHRTEGPRATMPIAADSWTLAENDIDSDVLSAYLESRRRGE
jgi:hypothetical protein